MCKKVKPFEKHSLRAHFANRAVIQEDKKRTTYEKNKDDKKYSSVLSVTMNSKLQAFEIQPTLISPDPAEKHSGHNKFMAIILRQ